MAGSYLRRPLSGAADGKNVLITATSGTGTTIHTAQADATLVDVITLDATNNHPSQRIRLTLQWGGVNDPDDFKHYWLDPYSTIEIKPDGILRNSLVLRAIATIASYVTVGGFINRES